MDQSLACCLIEVYLRYDAVRMYNYRYYYLFSSTSKTSWANDKQVRVLLFPVRGQRTTAAAAAAEAAAVAAAAGSFWFLRLYVLTCNSQVGIKKYFLLFLLFATSSQETSKEEKERKREKKKKKTFRHSFGLISSEKVCNI